MAEPDMAEGGLPERITDALELSRQLTIIAHAEAFRYADSAKDGDERDHIIKYVAENLGNSGEFEIARFVAGQASEAVAADIVRVLDQWEASQAAETEEVDVGDSAPPEEDPVRPFREAERWIEIANFFDGFNIERDTLEVIADLVPNDGTTGLELFKTVLEREAA